MERQPALEWEGPDEDGDVIVRLTGVEGWLMAADGKTQKEALGNLGEGMMLAAFPETQLELAARAMRKVLTPELLEEVLQHLDPLAAFVKVLRESDDG